MRHFLLIIPFMLFSMNSLYAASICARDDAGRQVCTSKPIQRIVSLSPGSTELIFAAGGGDRVVGIDEHSDYPPSVSTIQRIGGYPNISIESIVALKPDLIVAWAGGNSPQLTSMLESFGSNLFYINPVNFTEISSVIRRLGSLLETMPEASESADAVDRQYQALKAQYSFKPAITVFYEIWNNPLMTINRNHIIGQVIEVCGGKNVYANASAQVPRISMESLLAANPQVISSSTFIKDGKTIEERWSNWKTITAVKNSAFITIDGDRISRPTPRALEAAKELCKKLDAVRAFQSPQQSIVKQP